MPRNTKLKRQPRKLLLSLLVLLLIFFAYSFTETYRLKTETTVFSDPDIPQSFLGKKIVFVSDIHLGPFFSASSLKKIVAKVNALNPDLVILGGDYIQRDKKYIEPCFIELKNLQAPLGVYAVLGNHDYWEDAALVRKNLLKAGLKPLDNQSYWLKQNPDKIKLGGVGDFFYDFQNLNATIKDVNETDFVILASHNPDYAEALGTNKIDLVLSGHTHAGQITFFGLWAPFIPSIYGQKYRHGLIDNGFAKVLVSSGLGPTLLPLRFFARPEINLIILSQ